MANIKLVKPKFKKLQLTFENCELHIIDRKDIECFYLGDITKNISFVDYHPDLCTDYSCSFVQLVLKRSANKNHLFKRLNKWKDITHIELIDDSNKSIITVSVPWGNNDYINDKQHHRWNSWDKGTLEIIIKR